MTKLKTLKDVETDFIDGTGFLNNLEYPTSRLQSRWYRVLGMDDNAVIPKDAETYDEWSRNLGEQFIQDLKQMAIEWVKELQNLGVKGAKMYGKGTVMTLATLQPISILVRMFNLTNEDINKKA